MKTHYVVISDEHSKLFGHRILNSQLSLYLGLVQLLVCIWALSQHIWAMFTLKEILHCDFSDNSTLPPMFTRVDAIIYDIGLFHHLWGITGCVAQHLDGGYGRFCWCIAHILALLVCLPFAFSSRPRPYFLWPLLIQQSAYGVGMLILSLAAFPKAAQLIGDLQNAPIRPLIFYTFGTLMNFFLLYVYWHWYWHVETLWNSARKLKRGETLNKNNNRRPFRRASPVGENILGSNGNLYSNSISTQQGMPQILNGNLNNGAEENKKQTSISILNGNHTITLPITKIQQQKPPKISQNNHQNYSMKNQNNLSFDSDISLPSTVSTTSTIAQQQQLPFSELFSTQQPYSKKYYSLSSSSLPPLISSSPSNKNQQQQNRRLTATENQFYLNKQNIQLPPRVLHLRKQERFGLPKPKNSLEENSCNKFREKSIRRASSGNYNNNILQRQYGVDNEVNNEKNLLTRTSLPNGDLLIENINKNSKNSSNLIQNGQKQLNKIKLPTQKIYEINYGQKRRKDFEINGRRISSQLPLNDNPINRYNNNTTPLLTTRCSLPIIEQPKIQNPQQNQILMNQNPLINPSINTQNNSQIFPTYLNNSTMFNSYNENLIENSVWNFRQKENLNFYQNNDGEEEETWRLLPLN
uniref:Uncharacterized protein n=1 Tax=Meloidogyne enterolobii TaxID=390850 RepID=A0A6V7WP16_MELEN|nr:unnamed protein product [Meloidogyne enterolobii]